MTVRITLPAAVRDRLMTFGSKGMTSAGILTDLMDRVNREDLVRELRREYEETPRKAYVALEDL